MTLILNGTDNSATTPAVTGTDTDTGVYYPAANQVALATNGTLALRVDASQNVFMGDGVSGAVSPTLRLGNSGSAGGVVTATLALGSYGTGYGANLISSSNFSGSSASYLAFGTTPSGASGLSAPVERARFNSTGALVFAGGSTSADGIGITFPATQSASSDANTLDDYEEGTFTPTAFGNTSAGTTVYGSQIGSYTKIGRQVTITVALQYSSLTGTGELRFGNFPFVINGSEYTGSIMTDNLNWTAGTSIVLYGIPGSTSSVIFGSADDTAWSPQQCVNETAGFRFTLTYFTS
jgi:hypothetical protein